MLGATIETIFIECRVSNETILVGMVYNRPGTSSELFLADLNSLLDKINSKCIIMGDLNNNLLEYNNNQVLDFVNCFKEYAYTPYITKPTRVANNSATIIDHIWASEDLNIINATGTFFGISDHMGIFMKLNKTAPAPEKETTRFRDYRKYDVQAFNTSLQQNLNNSQIEEYLTSDDVNTATTTLIKILQETAQKHAPMVEKKNAQNKKKHLPWFTSQLKEMINVKNEWLSDFYSHGLNSYKPRITAISNKITQMKRSLKRSMKRGLGKILINMMGNR